MAYGTVKASYVQSDTAGTPPQFNDGNGTQTGTLCRAWVKFAGATGVIGASFNVSSVTRTTTGQWTINFATAMPDANYSTVATGSGYQSAGNGQTTSGTSIYVFYANTTSGGLAYYDSTYVGVAVFR